MRTIKTRLPLTASLLLIGAVCSSAWNETYNTMRLAYWGGLPIAVSYLERVGNAGYTHVLCQISVADPDNWQDGEYHGTDFINAIRDAFVLVHDRGLTLIPMFECSGRHAGGTAEAGHFRNTNNSQIQWAGVTVTDLLSSAKNKVLEDKLGPSEANEAYDHVYSTIADPAELARLHSICNSFAPEPDGIDKSVASMLSVIAQAYDLAYRTTVGTANPMAEHLPYIHIGHDEPITFVTGVERVNQLLVGVTQSDKQWVYHNMPLHGGIETMVVPDREPPVIYYGHAKTYALRALLAGELERRVAQIENVEVGGVKTCANTQVLLFGDIWDPSHFGGYFDLAGAIGLLPERLKDKVIFMPWQYDGCRLAPSPEITFPGFWNTDIVDGESDHISVDANVDLNASGVRYDPAASFKHFADNGYRVIWTWSYPNGDPFIEADNLKVMFDFDQASRQAGSTVVGYCAAAWGATPEFVSKWGFETNWNPGLLAPDGMTVMLYEQNAKYNVLELLTNVPPLRRPNGTNCRVLERTGTGVHNSTFHGFLMSLPDWRPSSTGDAYQIDSLETTRLDYFLRNRNLLFSNCDTINVPKNEVSFNDAVLYCRNLTLREAELIQNVVNLVPIPAFPWNTPPETGSFRAGLSEAGATCKTQLLGLGEAAGGPPVYYRLPTVAELEAALSQGIITKRTPDQPEWVSVADPRGMGWAYANGVLTSHDSNTTTLNCAFRVVRFGLAAESASREYAETFNYYLQQGGISQPEQWGFANVANWTVPREDDGSAASPMASTYLQTTSPGGWTGMSACITPGFMLNRLGGSVEVDFRLRFPTNYGPSWRENNKVWITLMDASSAAGTPVPTYRLLFKPNRRQDQYTSYDLRLSRFDGVTETTLRDAWTHTVTPNGTTGAWVNFRIILEPEGAIKVSYDNGTGTMQQYIDLVDNTYAFVTHLRFEYKTGTVAEGSNYFILADNIEVNHVK